jgi:hypothetical protein
MPADRPRTSIHVDVDPAGYRTVAVSGTLDAAAVAAVRAAAEEADPRGERLVLDLIGVTAVEDGALARLARSLRDLGVDLDVLSSPADPGRAGTD